MKEQLEIEFKNLLSVEEYNKIYNYYNLSKQKTINNANYYYDNHDELLKQNNAALRIRHTDTKKEMTLKIKGLESNIEINVPINFSNILEVLNVGSLDEAITSKLRVFGIEKELFLFQKIVTKRKELELDTGLLVLDKNYFLNDVVDYELEFEVANFELGQSDFQNILNSLDIAKKPALPKIARAQKYKNTN